MTQHEEGEAKQGTACKPHVIVWYSVSLLTESLMARTCALQLEPTPVYWLGHFLFLVRLGL